jgi:hypothetical protein
MFGVDWILPAGLWLLALLHHVLAIRAQERFNERQSILQRQLEMLREAIALSKYGAKEEAEQVIDEAVALGEK